MFNKYQNPFVFHRLAVKERSFHTDIEGTICPFSCFVEYSPPSADQDRRRRTKMSVEPAPHRAVFPFLLAVLCAVMVAPGCEFEEPSAERANIGGPVVDPDTRVQRSTLPAEAPCTINVEGYGAVDIEEDYIPNVVACENGNAPMEALKAQAVQARGYIYYKLFVTGEDTVENSTGDQVYQCNYTDAQQRHFEAARATRAEYVRWNDQVVASFYVAGAIPADQQSGAPEDACQGPGGNDPTTTEQFVTYNLGKSGCDIDMTPLGWIPDDNDCTRNPQNRGCASQNGQSCLANRGWDYEQMIPYYYGDDIAIERAGGECGGPWIEPTEHNLYCQDQSADGWSCFDDDERVYCAGDQADDAEPCAHECSDGQCVEPPDEFETYCAQEAPQDDGWYCVDDTTRVLCEGGEPEATEICSAECENDICQPIDPEQNQAQNDGQNSENGAQEPDNAAENQENGSEESEHGGDTDGEGFSLVTESPGVEGGCRQVGVVSGASIAAAVLLLLVVAAIRRSERDVHFVP